MKHKFFIETKHSWAVSVYGKKSFFSAQNQKLRSYRVYISPTKKTSSALRSA